MSPDNFYVFPDLGRYDLGIVRLLGAGIGNLLFPWARAHLIARNHELPLINPTWPNLRVGSILRGENDSRFYFDLFDDEPGAVCGIDKLIKLVTLKRMSESGIKSKGLSGNSGIVLVKGVGLYFESMREEHDFIRGKLLQITRPKHKRGLEFDFQNSATVHVRLGDFKVGKITTPIEWYSSVIGNLRNELGEDLNIYLFSDGSDEELSRLLELKNVRRLAFGSSVADMLAMSNSQILVGSRYSTFSMWASYIGQMPTVWPVDPIQRPISSDPGLEFQAGDDGLSKKFVDLCKARLGIDRVLA